MICERGAIGRVEKSAAVAARRRRRHGARQHRRRLVAHDLHAVPTVHLGRDAGRAFLRVAGSAPRVAGHPAPGRTVRPTARVAPWSSAGDPTAVSSSPTWSPRPTGLLAGTVPDASGSRWALASGTSAATAWTSGAAAVLLARHDWSAAAVRSALADERRPGPGGVLRSGAGALGSGRHSRTTLAYTVDPGDYRSWLRGDLREVNTPSLLVPGAGTATRRLTNVGGRSGTWQVSVDRLRAPRRPVSPASLTLRPASRRRYRVTRQRRVARRRTRRRRVVWTGADGVEVRIPVAISR